MPVLCRTFFVAGLPAGDPRARGTIIPALTPFVRMYKPRSKADDWKKCVAINRPDRPILFEGPVAVELEFLLPRPGRLQRKKVTDARIAHASKPDIDNLEKSTLDAMTEAGWWRDDSQVSQLRTSKWYAARGERSGCLVTVSGDSPG